MLGTARADDDRRHARVGEQPREGERRRVAAALERHEAVEDPVVERCSYGSGRSVIRDPAGAGSPRRYLPVSQPPASGLNGVKPRPCSAQSGSTSRSASRSSSEYEFCTQSKRPSRQRFAQTAAPSTLLSAVGRDLALRTQLVERRSGLGDRHVGIPVVGEEQVDALDAEPLQARLELPLHARGREAVVGALVHRVERLRREDDLVADAAPFERSQSPMDVSLRPPP